MGLGMSGDADLEIRHPLQAGHQLRGIGITAGVWLVRTAAGSISTEGHDVAHPRLPVTAGDLLYLAAVRAHAGEMGGGARPEWCEPREGLPQLLLHGDVAGREELEGDRWHHGEGVPVPGGGQWIHA